jgi:hypothetical protein
MDSLDCDFSGLLAIVGVVDSRFIKSRGQEKRNKVKFMENLYLVTEGGLIETLEGLRDLLRG